MASPIELVSSWFRNTFDLNKTPTPYQSGTNQGQSISDYYEAFLQYLGWAGYTSYDIQRPKYIEDGYMRNADVYAVINQIATKSSSIPFSIRKVKNKARAERLQYKRASMIGGDAKSVLEYKIMDAQAYDSEPLPLPIMRPNPHQTWPEFIALYKIFWNACGEVFLFWQSPENGPNAGKPTQIFILPSHLVQIKVKGGWPKTEGEVGIDPVDYYCIINQEKMYRFPRERVIHTTMPNPYFDFHGRHLYGLSPLMSVWQEIMAGNEGNANNLRMQKSGGAIGFIHGMREVLEEDQAKQLKQRIVEMRNDPNAMAQIAGISMQIGFTRVALDYNEIGMFENQKYVQKKICNSLGWSDKLLNNDEGAKYDNMQQAYKVAITNKIMPDLNTLEEALNREFLPKFGKEYAGAEWVFHYEQLPEMQDDINEQSKWIIPLVNAAVITRAQARQILGMEQDDNPILDVYTTSMNTMPLENAVAPNLDSIINDNEQG